MKNALFLLLAVAFAASIVGYRNFARVEHRVFISWFFRKNAVIFLGIIYITT